MEVTPDPKPVKRKKTRTTHRKLRAAVSERANGYCEVRTDGCALRGGHAHHRKRRSHGGENVLDNLLWVCVPCHDFIHAHPALSYERGWMTRGVQ